ncbi:MAG: hypothetical protein CL927_12450 [Deltaproteobacteria bacterium]|nr:hypothetical protein [Deltaproteobacteria bacterium]HCH61252.1 hypothetical protein [Deltaproteobacteria bacterium]
MASPMCSHTEARRTPSRDALRRKALTAAASVVFAFSAASCGSDEPVKDSDLDADIPVSMVDSGQQTEEGGGSDSGEAGSTDDSGTTSPMEDTGEDMRPDCTEVPAEDWTDCCRALEEWCAEEYATDREAAAECLYGPDYDGSTGCMAWGPPVPPRAMV